MTTYFPHGEVQGKWYLVDAKDQITGRLASNVARYLRGKHRPDYTPHADMGDNVIIINAEKVRWTGKKHTDKLYYRHSGYPGGLKTRSLEDRIARNPRAVVESAVKGMLPRGPLGRTMFRRLNVYIGSEHPHSAQQPQILEL